MDRKTCAICGRVAVPTESLCEHHILWRNRLCYLNGHYALWERLDVEFFLDQLFN